MSGRTSNGRTWCSGWINSVGNLGGFVGPYGVGCLRDLTQGFTVALLALASMLVFAAVLGIRVPRDEGRLASPRPSASR